MTTKAMNKRLDRIQQRIEHRRHLEKQDMASAIVEWDILQSYDLETQILALAAWADKWGALLVNTLRFK